MVGSSFGVLENAEEGVIQVYDELGIAPPTYESTPVFIPVQSFTHAGSEKEIYWFHPDHLGSTSYITNIFGEVSQHMEYFAFGETFVEEHRSSNNSPYKFNGKELDEETGWYYYGARYYDPRISVWLSVDPLASYDPFQNSEHYIDGQHNGGVFNAMNLNVYGYTYQNPLKYIDPNGKQIEVTSEGSNTVINLTYKIDNQSSNTDFSSEKLMKNVEKWAEKVFKGHNIVLRYNESPDATIPINLKDVIRKAIVTTNADGMISIKNGPRGDALPNSLGNNRMNLALTHTTIDGETTEESDYSYYSLGGAFLHELLHMLGLYHPYDAENTISDIQQSNAKINGGNIPNSTIRNNIMNSGANEQEQLRNSNGVGNELTSGQAEYIRQKVTND